MILSYISNDSHRAASFFLLFIFFIFYFFIFSTLLGTEHLAKDKLPGPFLKMDAISTACSKRLSSFDLLRNHFFF
jgi:hypothetical protein